MRWLVVCVCALGLLVSGTGGEECCVKVDTATKQLVDAQGEMGTC